MTAPMDGIAFFDDVFDPEFCRWLLADSRTALAKTRQFDRSNYQWAPLVVHSSQPVLVREYPSRIEQFILARLKERGIIDTLGFNVMNYAWSRLSYIPWHNDGHRGTAVTVYLNDSWDRDWGGLFLYEGSSRDDIRAVVPHFNCGLRNSRHLQHATTLVALDAPEPRFTLQLFSVN